MARVCAEKWQPVSGQPHPTEQTWRIFAPKSGGRWVVLLDTSSKTAAALRHKMLPCFALRPPRSSARHTLVCQSRPRLHTTRLCRRPRPMRKLSDLPSPTRNPSRRRFITAFQTPLRVSQNLRVATTSESAPGVALYASERADMSIIELALSTMCGWCVFSVVLFCIVRSTMRDIRGCQF